MMSRKVKVPSKTTSPDITERKKAEEKLAESEEFSASLLANSPNPILVLNPDTSIKYVNLALEDLTGFSSAEIIGRKAPYPWWTADPESGNVSEREKDIRQEVRGLEKLFRKKNGEQFWIEITNAPVTRNGEFKYALTNWADITERKRMEERVEHLNTVLRAIRNVNQLIAREKDRDKLLKDTCDSLIETRGYRNAWLAVLDEHGGLVTTAESGLGKEFLPVVKWLKRGELTSCSRRALRQSEVVVTEDPSSTCTDCPLSRMYRGRGAMTVCLEHGGKTYGILSVSVPRGLSTDEEEQSLVKELASDIAFALQNIELEQERKRMGLELQEKNEQLDAQNEELIAKTREVERANRLKSEFLANMSHELRTPLNVIIGFSELMIDEVPGKVNEEQRQCLSDVLHSSQHLLNLINDVLDLSKIESGKVEFKLKDVALTKVVASLARTMMPILTPRKQNLDVEVEEGLPLVRADEAKLGQVLLNLVDNASKSTPDGGKLKIEVISGGDWCQVNVIDNGIGIKKEDQERIFEPFCQLDNPLIKGKMGTGLGLTLVKQIVERCGGRIWVESELGKGSWFTFTVPLATSGEPIQERSRR